MPRGKSLERQWRFVKTTKPPGRKKNGNVLRYADSEEKMQIIQKLESDQNSKCWSRRAVKKQITKRHHRCHHNHHKITNSIQTTKSIQIAKSIQHHVPVRKLIQVTSEPDVEIVLGALHLIVDPANTAKIIPGLVGQASSNKHVLNGNVPKCKVSPLLTASRQRAQQKQPDDQLTINKYPSEEVMRRMCSPFPSLLKPPGLHVPDMIVPDDLNPTSATQTGYTILRPFLNGQGREITRVLGDGNCLFRAISQASC
ncbi:uncharacterized protein [Dysidea avara]|uniref:uncharacterized protein isoform X1 n=1 Tax=Dysidea avara TaxID=196820 RepID=UPI003316674F